MANVLIATAGAAGQTPAIADAIAHRLGELSHKVLVRDIRSGNTDPGAGAAWLFDAVVIVAQVTRSGLPPELSGFFMRHACEMRTRPSALVTVSLLAASHDPHDLASLRELSDRFLFELGWHPEGIEHVAGAVSERQREMLEQAGGVAPSRLPESIQGMMTQAVPAAPTDVTDWGALDRFAQRFSALLAPH